MQSVPAFFIRKTAAFLLLLFILSLVFIQHSCKKTDFATAVADQDLKKDFFTPTGAISKQIQGYITILKQENDRRNFVNALPRNIGRPIWEKLGIRPMMNTAARGGDSGTHFLVIPFAPSGAYLHGLLIAIPSDTGYRTTYYSKEFLNTVCHQSNKDIPQVESLLGLFMMMENTLFNRTDFYHIPRDIFLTNARIVLTDSTKIASMTAAEEDGGEGKAPPLCYLVPSGVHHTNEQGACDWTTNCSTCSGWWCGGTPPEYPIPGGGGGPPDNPPPPPGGGGGGGGNPPPPPVPCDAPFYLVDPCNPPLPPEPVPPYNPYLAAPIVLDTSITKNFPCVPKIMDSISTYANANAIAQVVLHQIFNVDKKIHLDFVADRNLTKDSIDGDTKTTEAYTTTNPDGTEGVDFFAKIRLNYWVLKHSTQEYIAATIVHEAIHAYINYKGYQYLQGVIDSTTFKTLFPLYWPFRPVGNGRFFNSGNERAQHEGMATNMINIMADILKGVHNNQQIPANLRDSAYRSVSWGGLMETRIWYNTPDTGAIKGFNEVLRDTSLRVPIHVPGHAGNFMNDYRTLKAKAFCL